MPVLSNIVLALDLPPSVRTRRGTTPSDDEHLIIKRLKAEIKTKNASIKLLKQEVQETNEKLVAANQSLEKEKARRAQEYAEHKYSKSLAQAKKEESAIHIKSITASEERVQALQKQLKEEKEAVILLQQDSAKKVEKLKSDFNSQLQQKSNRLLTERQDHSTAMEELKKKQAEKRDEALEKQQGKWQTEKKKLQDKQKEKKQEWRESGLLLPQLRAAYAPSGEKQAKDSMAKRVQLFKANVEAIPPDVLAATILKISQGKEENTETYLQMFMATPEMDSIRRDAIVGAVKKIEDTWNGKMEAEIKLTSGISDELLEFIRDYRSKDYDEASNRNFFKEIEPGIPFPIPASKRQRNKDVARRAKDLDITSNEIGTAAHADLLSAMTSIHNSAVKEGNTLWKPGETQDFIISGDALNTGRGENHTLVCVRLGTLIDGFSSAFNFRAITNYLGDDHHPSLSAALNHHKKTVDGIVSEKKFSTVAKKAGEVVEEIAASMYTTADMAYGLSQFGLNPSASTYGNPWITEFDSAGLPVWRGDDDQYLFSHVKPPHLDFPFTCDCCKKVFENQEQVDEDKRLCGELSKEAYKRMTKAHYGNYPHEVPIFNIPPSKYLPPICHYGENLFQWRFKHLIWSQAKDNFVQYKINELLHAQIGYCHLPPTKGDDCYMMSFIGADICNLRAKADVLAKLIKMVYPSDFIDDSAPQAPEPPAPVEVVVDEDQLDECDNLYSDSEEDEPTAEAIDRVATIAAHLSSAKLTQSQRVAEAFDTAFEALDCLVYYDDWEDDEQGREKKAKELQEVGKRTNDAVKAALSYPVFSEYMTVSEFVVPHMIKKHGKLVLRANEQGQEAAGQMIKRMIKHGR